MLQAFDAHFRPHTSAVGRPRKTSNAGLRSYATASATTPCSPMVMVVTPVSPSRGASRKNVSWPQLRGRSVDPWRKKPRSQAVHRPTLAKSCPNPFEVQRNGPTRELSHVWIVETVSWRHRRRDLSDYSPPSPQGTDRVSHSDRPPLGCDCEQPFDRTARCHRCDVAMHKHLASPR